MIEVLFEGTHTNHHFNNGHYRIHPLGSSVTLIRHDGVNVLFDTGSFPQEELLMSALKARGLEPKDIHHVFNSHYHLDHTFNDHLFKGTAKIHTSYATLFEDGAVEVYPDSAARTLPNFIDLVRTPGHTGPDASLAYEWEGRTWMCAGDAVREDIIRQETRLTAANPEQFIDSLKLIFARADVIVPGHGRIIEGPLKDELARLVSKLTTLPHVTD